MNTNELLLKTAFCCMACDGEIAKEEISFLKQYASKNEYFKEMDVEAIVNNFVDSINDEGHSFLYNYLTELKESNLDVKNSLQVIDIAFSTIEADNEIQYSEISFFKKIRKQLSITDQNIEAAYPNKEDLEDYLLPDVEITEKDWNVHFSNIKFSEA